MTCRFEEDEQRAVAEYLDWLGVLYNHSPNEGQRAVQYTVKLKALGMKAGFPDIFIYEPRGEFCGLAIELKRVSGGRVSDAQRDWIDKLNARGYKAVVCKGFDEAKRTIDDYMKNNP